MKKTTKKEEALYREIVKQWLKDTLASFSSNLKWMREEERISNVSYHNSYHVQLGNFATSKERPATKMKLYNLHKNGVIAEYDLVEIYSELQNG